MGGWTSVKQEKQKCLVGALKKENIQKEAHPFEKLSMQEREGRVLIESDEEIEGGFACLIDEERGAYAQLEDKGSYTIDEVKVEGSSPRNLIHVCEFSVFRQMIISLSCFYPTLISLSALDLVLKDNAALLSSKVDSVRKGVVGGDGIACTEKIFIIVQSRDRVKFNPKQVKMTELSPQVITPLFFFPLLFTPPRLARQQRTLLSSFIPRTF
ncbi:hypothetical protein CRG98_039658 [Punica granatum]|uniref:Uncharacterized protein n=1 Tax=Punica granatum TaxID=22663 RepID=A0A2I0I7L8_PUNGR|nr:hypothetical protein CRG98_039658 [Punica granatum]